MTAVDSRKLSNRAAGNICVTVLDISICAGQGIKKITITTKQHP